MTWQEMRESGSIHDGVFPHHHWGFIQPAFIPSHWCVSVPGASLDHHSKGDVGVPAIQADTAFKAGYQLGPPGIDLNLQAKPRRKCQEPFPVLPKPSFQLTDTVIPCCGKGTG